METSLLPPKTNSDSPPLIATTHPLDNYVRMGVFSLGPVMKDNNLAIRIRIKDDNFTPTQLPENDAQQELLWFRDLLVLGLVIILVAGGWWAWQYSNDESSGNKQIASNAEVPVTAAAAAAAPVATPKPDTPPEIQSALQSTQANAVEPDTSTNVSPAAPGTSVVADDTAIAAPMNTYAVMSSSVNASTATEELSEVVTPATQVPESKPDAVIEVTEVLDTAKTTASTKTIETAKTTEPARASETKNTVESTGTVGTLGTTEALTSEALTSEESQSLPEPPEVQLSDNSARAEVKLITSNISAASLSLEMIDYKPGQPLAHTVYLENKTLVTIYFFASYQGLQGQSISHRWLHNGKPVATIQSRIEQARSGAHSSKRINRVMHGAWAVQVLSESGELLAEGRFDVAPPES